MMSNRLRWMPAMVTLSAVAIASIMTYIYQYEVYTSLLIIIVVLLVFFGLSTLLQSLIVGYEIENARKEMEAKAEEGKVVEKENEGDEGAEQKNEDTKADKESN